MKNVFLNESHVFLIKKPLAGLHHIEDRLGDAPTPLISNQNPSKHQIIGFWKSAAEAAA